MLRIENKYQANQKAMLADTSADAYCIRRIAFQQYFFFSFLQAECLFLLQDMDKGYHRQRTNTTERPSVEMHQESAHKKGELVTKSSSFVSPEPSPSLSMLKAFFSPRSSIQVSRAAMPWQVSHSRSTVAAGSCAELLHVHCEMGCHRRIRALTGKSASQSSSAS